MQRFWTTAELKSRGEDDRSIARAVARNDVVLVRKGVFAAPDAPADLVRAVRVGGLATAHTAARARGLWTPPDPRAPDGPLQLLRVAVPRTTSLSRLHDPDDPTRPLLDHPGVVLTWSGREVIAAGRRHGVVPVLVMLRDLFRSEPPERALAVVDSALRHRHIRRTDLPALAALLPERLAGVVALADERAQSGIETVARCLLVVAGLRVEPQAAIDGVGRVDLLVEGRVVVEVDGREWHDDADRFEEDRRRDAWATIGRYRVLRFSWFRVLFRWHEVEAAVFAALAS